MGFQRLVWSLGTSLCLWGWHEVKRTIFHTIIRQDFGHLCTWAHLQDNDTPSKWNWIFLGYRRTLAVFVIPSASCWQYFIPGKVPFPRCCHCLPVCVISLSGHWHPSTCSLNHAFLNQGFGLPQRLPRRSWLTARMLPFKHGSLWLEVGLSLFWKLCHLSLDLRRGNRSDIGASFDPQSNLVSVAGGDGTCKCQWSNVWPGEWFWDATAKRSKRSKRSDQGRRIDILVSKMLCWNKEKSSRALAIWFRRRYILAISLCKIWNGQRTKPLCALFRRHTNHAIYQKEDTIFHWLLQDKRMMMSWLRTNMPWTTVSRMMVSDDKSLAQGNLTVVYQKWNDRSECSLLLPPGGLHNSHTEPIQCYYTKVPEVHGARITTDICEDCKMRVMCGVGRISCLFLFQSHRDPLQRLRTSLSDMCQRHTTSSYLSKKSVIHLYLSKESVIALLMRIH